MADQKMVRATTSFGVARPKKNPHNGPYTVVHEGDVVPASDPLVRKYPELFGPIDPVERATANPGEHRAVAPPKTAEPAEAKAPAKKPAPKKAAPKKPAASTPPADPEPDAAPTGEES